MAEEQQIMSASNTYVSDDEPTLVVSNKSSRVSLPGAENAESIIARARQETTELRGEYDSIRNQTKNHAKRLNELQSKFDRTREQLDKLASIRPTRPRIGSEFSSRETSAMELETVETTTDLTGVL